MSNTILHLKRYWVLHTATILAAAMVWISTLQGPGVGGDATIYITSAKNLVRGIGLGLINPDGSFRLIPYFPPFYPLVLSLFAMLHMDVVTAARWLDILLFAGTVFIVLKTTDDFLHNWQFSLALGMLLAVSPVLVPVYSWVMSEPLSIFLGILALVLALQAWKQPQKKFLLHLSALFAGLSALTRYGAVVYAAAIFGLLLFYWHGKFLQRMKSALLYALESALPLIIWMIVDLKLTDTVSSRSVPTLAGIGARFVGFFIDIKSVILFWLLPDSWITDPFYPGWMNTLIVIVFILALGIGSWFLIKRTDSNADMQRLTVGLVLFCGLYVLMTLVIVLATYPPITIGTRMFSPMNLMVLWLLVLILYAIWQAGKKEPLISTAALLAVIIFTLWSGWRGARIIDYNRTTGLGFQSAQWQSSDLISYIQSIPEDKALVSNEEMAVLYLTGRRAYPLAEIYFDQSVFDFYSYGTGQSPDAGELQFRQGAYLILFNSIYDQLSGLYGNRTEERINQMTDGLKLVYHGKDGNVFLFNKSVEE